MIAQMSVAVGLTVAIAGLTWWKLRLARRPRFATVQEMMSSLAEQAVAMARQNHQVDLDYTPASIEKVEQVLARLNEDYRAGKLRKGIDGLAMSLGAYVGESIRRSEPEARWERDHAMGGRDSFPVYWGGRESFPCAWCFRRLTSGPEESVWVKYQAQKRGQAGS